MNNHLSSSPNSVEPEHEQEEGEKRNEFMEMNLLHFFYKEKRYADAHSLYDEYGEFFRRECD